MQIELGAGAGCVVLVSYESAQASHPLRAEDTPGTGVRLQLRSSGPISNFA